MDEQINESTQRINAFLQEHGQDITTISKSRLAQFEKVDDAIQAHLKEIEKAESTIHAHRINVSLMAIETGIARKTFYNNDLLRLYVEKYSPDEAPTVAEQEHQKLKEKQEELEVQLNRMILRDITAENLRNENIRLGKEIQLLQRRNTNLEEELEKALAKIRELEKSPKRILQFTPNTPTAGQE